MSKQIKKARIIIGHYPLYNFRGTTVCYEASSFYANSIYNEFYFSNCPADTDTIVFRDCGHDFDYIHFFKMITDGVIVHRQSEKRFVIFPQLVFITNYKPEIPGLSFAARFEIVEADKAIF